VEVTVMDTTLRRVGDPHASLERLLVEEFLQTRGHTWRSLSGLERTEADTLLGSATLYATLRLAEIESRAHYLDEVRRLS
jgi:hypothetical protein